MFAARSLDDDDTVNSDTENDTTVSVPATRPTRPATAPVAAVAAAAAPAAAEDEFDF